MAKIKSMFKIAGTVHDLTHVQSKAYGAHVRAPRGTYKNAQPNKTLIRNYRRTALLNHQAKPVFDALKELGTACRENFLWQHILSRFRKSAGNQPLQLLQQLEGLELNRKYPLLPLLPNSFRLISKPEKKTIAVHLDNIGHPVLPKEATAYRLEVSLIYYYGTKNRCSSESCLSDWIFLKDKAPNLSWQFPKRKDLCYLICVRLQARMGAVIASGAWGNRMVVLRVVEGVALT